MKMNKDAGESGTVRIYNAFTGKVEVVNRIVKTDAEWKKILTPEAYAVTRKKGTEAPFGTSCAAGGAQGLYSCVCCGTALFSVREKFESGTGWPSFYKPVSDHNVTEMPERSHGMSRTEVLCSRCGAHLGHVFDDGPPPTGRRYCINSVSLKLSEEGKTQRAVFAAGCFWGVEKLFAGIKGVVSTRVGYTGGFKPNPAYEDVCSGKTGHAESVEVQYDPLAISYKQLLGVFFENHDPTTLNRQGPDTGSQYRSAIFYTSAEQKNQAVELLEELDKSKKFGKKIVTQIMPAGEFFPAEEYHQKYLFKGREY